MSDILAQLAKLQEADLPVDGGRTLAYVYASGLADVERIGREAVAAYAGSNGLDPTAFPSLLAMENDLVAQALELVGGPDSAVGTVTGGGTESVLLAVQGARDSRPDIAHPRMVLPETAHPAFHKAAHYFGVEAVLVGVDEEFRARPEAMAAAIDDRTVLVAVSTPSYAHGVVDPVTEIAAAAAARGVRCHVDACIGGWVLPYAARLGRPVRPWTFAVDGVTSISLDLHKYAYAPKGTSVLLHRTAALRRPQFFASARWPGYTVLNTTLQSTKSGGPLAGAWAVVNSIGDAGYLELTGKALGAVDEIVAGIERIEALRIVVRPDSTLIAVATDGSCDVFTIVDAMSRVGWHVQPQLSFNGTPPSFHLSVSAATADHVEEFLEELEKAVACAVETGPVHVAPEIVELVRSLDPADLTEEDFDGLLAGLGLGGDPSAVDSEGASVGGAPLGLPEAMAPINALLDLASPTLREALLTAFLDRLLRPTRL